MNIVVIGSNSFSGASFVREALRKNFRVIGLSRSPEPLDAFLPYRWAGEDTSLFSFFQADLNHDTKRILDIVKDHKAEYVVNFAAQSMVAESWQNPSHWYATNVLANVQLHDGLRHFDFLKKYVHVSTPEVYGNCTGSVTEDTPFNPSTPYAASRAACDLHLQTFFAHYQFPVVFTRAANVYGPGQQLYRIIPRTILYILLGRKLQLHGGGHSVRSFIHIQDTVNATLRIMENASAGEVYHISTSRFISIRALVQLICQRMGKNFEDVVEIVDDRPGKDTAYILNSDKTRQAMGWTDVIELEEGIEQTIAWVNHFFDDLIHHPLDYIHKV